MPAIEAVKEAKFRNRVERKRWVTIISGISQPRTERESPARMSNQDRIAINLMSGPARKASRLPGDPAAAQNLGAPVRCRRPA